MADQENNGELSPRPEVLGGTETTEGQASSPPRDVWDAEIRPTGDGPVGQPVVFSTTLQTRSFLGISLINGLLNIVTLTLYRFWGKSEVRRRVWQGVRVNGEAFEYTGRGRELFVGFLLASLLLGIPFLTFVFAVQLLDEAFSLLVLPGYLLIFWLWGFGMFTAFRYMASRTTWRGIRFALFGSAPTYGFMWLGLQFANGMTAGWIQPIFERLLAEQVWNHMRFGDRRFRWNQARSERIGLYGPFALGWFGTIGVFIVAAVALGVIGAANPDFWDQVSQGMEGVDTEVAKFASPLQVAAVILELVVASVLVLMLWALVWSPYHAAVLRSVTAGVSLDEARFDMNAGAWSLWWLTCTNIALLVFSLGLLMPLVQARTAKYLVSRMRAIGQASLDEAHQAPPGPRTAEGLADAFGFSLI